MALRRDLLPKSDNVKIQQATKIPFITKMTTFLVANSGLSIPDNPFNNDPIQIPMHDPGRTPMHVAQTTVQSRIEVIEKKYVIRLKGMGVSRNMTTIFHPISKQDKYEMQIN
jgi:hypothetical protein